MVQPISDAEGNFGDFADSGSSPGSLINSDLTYTFPYLSKDAGLTDRLAEGLNKMEEELYHAISHTDSLANVTSRYLADAGGKRLRPLLTLLAAQCGEGITEKVVTAATIVELTHLATLYHDDVMDSAPLRRGARTVHEVWGNSVAILTGDLIFARASILASGLGPDAIRIHARTFERLCLGQLHETVGPKDSGEGLLQHYISVVGDKTGSLVATAAHLGALLAGAAADTVECLIEYGEKVGVAFQLADDIIDLIGGNETSGKVAGTDLREGVSTLPVLLARKAADDGDVQAQKTVALIDSDLSADEDLAEAVASLVALPVIPQAQKIVEQWAQEAIAAIAPLECSDIKGALTAFVEEMSVRTS